MGQLTAGTVIQRSRDLSSDFVVERHPDRGAVDYLSDRHAQTYRKIANILRDRFSEGRNVADTISNSLVGVDSNGVAFSVTTSGDGFDVIVDATSEFLYTGPTAIAQDPYTTGFPLPEDAIEIIEIYAENSSTNTQWPVRWHPHGDARRFTGLHTLSAVVNNWRLVPIKNPTNLETRWDDVTNVVVVYISEPAALTTLASVLLVPHVYQHVFKWELAMYFSGRERALTDGSGVDMSSLFAQELARALSEIDAKTLELEHSHIKVHSTRRIR